MRALIGAGLTAGLIASSATAAAAHPEFYEVQSGDTLASIAAQFDEVSSWRELHESNGLADPNLIHVGQRIDLWGGTAVNASPAPSTKSSSTKASSAKASSAKAPSSKASSSTGAGVWDRLAACESNGNWSINTGNGYYGGLQFSRSSWQAVGGSGYPHEASKQEQINRAEKLLDIQGWGAWPACSSRLGLR
jgi:LysM repeat protein